jgi:hypothetical protein
MPAKTVFSKIMGRVAMARLETRRQAERELWERNGLGNPKLRDGYKLAQTDSVARDGTEVTEYRLYKLIDAATVTIKSEVKSTIKLGIAELPKGEDNAGQTNSSEGKTG